MPRAVEYQRALRATKLERTFAKPLVCAMSDHTGAVTALCRPPASGTQDAAGVATVMSGSSTGEVLLVRLRSPGTRRRSSTGPRVCLSRVFSTKSLTRRLACGSPPHTPPQWDVGGHRVLRSFVGHTGEVTGVRISPRGDLAVSCGNDRTANLWRLVAPTSHEPRAGGLLCPRP